MAFQPKQITKYETAHLAELQGGVSETAIEHSLGLIPPFSPGNEYVIHDNACDFGAVTLAIMARLSDPTNTGITIDATDINAQFVAGCAALAEKNKWPVTPAFMSAQELTFSADRFTHSFTAFAFHCIGDHDDAAQQVFRTLKPGGLAIASIWLDMPHVDALQHAHWRTRGKEGPLPTLLPMEGFGEKDLRKALEAGGFEADIISCSTTECFLRIPDLKRWAQLAWSYLGHLPAGWSRADEGKWDEAVADIVEQLESGENISKNEKGETVLKWVACTALAMK